MSDYELEMKKKKQFSAVKNIIWLSITGSSAVIMITAAISLAVSSTYIFQVSCFLSGLFLFCITLLISSSGFSVIHPVVGGSSDFKTGDRYAVQINKRNRGMTSSGMLVILSSLLVPTILLLAAALFIQPSEILVVLSTTCFIVSIVLGRNLIVTLLHRMQIGV